MDPRFSNTLRELKLVRKVLLERLGEAKALYGGDAISFEELTVLGAIRGIEALIIKERAYTGETGTRDR